MLKSSSMSGPQARSPGPRAPAASVGGVCAPCTKGVRVLRRPRGAGRGGERAPRAGPSTQLRPPRQHHRPGTQGRPEVVLITLPRVWSGLAPVGRPSSRAVHQRARHPSGCGQRTAWPPANAVATYPPPTLGGGRSIPGQLTPAPRALRQAREPCLSFLISEIGTLTRPIPSGSHEG